MSTWALTGHDHNGRAIGGVGHEAFAVPGAWADNGVRKPWLAVVDLATLARATGSCLPGNPVLRPWARSAVEIAIAAVVASRSCRPDAGFSRSSIPPQATKKFPKRDKRLAQTATSKRSPFLLLGAGFWQKAGNPGEVNRRTMPHSAAQDAHQGPSMHESDVSVQQRGSGWCVSRYRSWVIWLSYRFKAI